VPTLVHHRHRRGRSTTGTDAAGSPPAPAT